MNGAATAQRARPSLLGPVPAWLLAVAMAFPTVAAWFYFVLLAGHEEARFAYLAGKGLQFSLPLLCLAVWTLPSSATLRRSWNEQASAVRLWTLLSAAGATALLALYVLTLRGSGLAEDAADRITPKLDDFGIGGLGSYLVLALLLSFAHSFLEEYYFRWFLYGGLRQRSGPLVANFVSSLAFMAHHVIVIATYLGPERWSLTVLLSLGVAAGGAFWAWLYERSGSLWAVWMSHVVADLVIMVIGWDLVGPA